MEDGDESTLFLCMGEAFARHERDMSDARDAVFELLVEEVWKVAMRSQHYLTLQYLDKPCESAWMSLYMSGYDRNFLNTTSLTSFLSGSRGSTAFRLQAVKAGLLSYNTTTNNPCSYTKKRREGVSSYSAKLQTQQQVHAFESHPAFDSHSNTED
ncbi:hypothetical protein F442_02416 [Phytophthora nicotianae P10297]|uniref:Uncharacterized protein n=1 Tax=Phytophthora nicotianae P10297 TaxID=1317064 RepID=W3A013_PHYNI|nr:hypothetical protein F442_02416 [Phytophthora nicotianae P10297]